MKKSSKTKAKKPICKNKEVAITVYPEIESAISSIVAATLRDVAWHAKRMGEVIWVPSLTCTKCGKYHDGAGKLYKKMDHVGTPMTEHSKWSQTLDGVIRALTQQL